jgi:hypothetical protein
LAHQEEAAERMERRAWARRAIEEEQRQRVHDQFLHQLTNTQWFADTISSFCEKYVGWKHLKRHLNTRASVRGAVSLSAERVEAIKRLSLFLSIDIEFLQCVQV